MNLSALHLAARPDTPLDIDLIHQVHAMTKSELIERLAQSQDLPRKRAEEAVNCIFEALAASLESGNRIEIRGFGSFSLKQHRAYVGRNPKTGEEVPVDSKQAIHFKVGKQLREMVDALTDEP